MHRAFSLVELSIVLVILGLLTGGILTGQSLIRAAELRSVVTQYEQYVTAAQSFRDKYLALPGDMSNATSFWLAANADPASCVTAESSTAATCNGNDDGKIYPSAGSNESYRFWQQLANAGLIEGSYSGITHGSQPYSSTPRNSPAGRAGNTLWFVWYWNPYTANPYVFDGAYENILQLGREAANSSPDWGFLKPEDIWNIDTKLDDGKPARGKLVVRAEAALSDCTDATGSTAQQASSLDAQYRLAAAASACALIFRHQF